MARWLLVLMIALLPLRGWVGEAMAGQMLQQRLAEMAHATPAAATPSTHDDCLGHGQTAGADAPVLAGEPQTKDNASFHAGCLTCASCQVCSAVALPALPVAAGTSPGLSQAPPQGRGWTAACAEPAGLFKPPIS